ncbi:MAG: matrixin family metalloprotease [Acidobacteriota bacterium]
MKRLLLVLLIVLLTTPTLSLACFAPGTSRAAVEHEMDSRRHEAAVGLDDRYNPHNSGGWSRTATDGNGLVAGEPITVTWAVVADGTTVNYGGVAQPSDLRSFLNGLYGDEATWMPLFHDAFDRWDEASGVTFVHVDYDDGSHVGIVNKGVLGVRADIRITGLAMDGNGGTLGSARAPNEGDIKIDTSDNYYDDTSNNSLRLRNVLAHEIGHALGLGHVCPNNDTKLMEAYASEDYDGPQLDDILGVNHLYGDTLESNETRGKATSLGTLDLGDTIFVDTASIHRGVDDDFYRFTYDGTEPLSIIVAPVGKSYRVADNNDDGASCNLTSNNTINDQDLSFWIYDGAGDYLTDIDNTDSGDIESLVNISSYVAGTYYLEVKGADDDVQMYDLTLVNANLNRIDFGTETVDERVRTDSISGVPNARVVMGPATYGDDAPGVIRLGNVSNTSFDNRFQEWDYQNGTHDNETASWIALPDGVSNLGGLEAEAGDVTVDHNWTRVDFSHTFSTKPVVIPTVTTTNGDSAVVARIKNLSKTGFDIRLLEEEANNGTHDDEVVHWIAIEKGETAVDGKTLFVGHTGNQVDEDWHEIDVPSDLVDDFFIAAMQTSLGSDPASLRYRKRIDISQPVVPTFHFDVKVHEEKSADNETDHKTENVGFIIID